MGLMFFPRGGSSQVARYLAAALPSTGWEVTLLCGSLGAPGEQSHAETFFRGLDVRAVDFTAALEAPDPLRADPPFHPSYEDRPGSPDRVFAKVDDQTFEHQVAAWTRALADAGAADADVLHLSHLTPMNEAAARAFPGVPVVGHLHGTEILMLNEIDAGPPPGWEHAEVWAERMRGWARGCRRLLVLSPDAIERVPEIFGIERERLVWSPNGFDPQIFDRRPLGTDDRLALWRRWLVDEPRGWDEGGEPGSISYTDAEIDAAFGDGPVLLYVGRFTEVKRIPLLIRAYAKVREQFGRRAPLVLFGGYPGEWEGEHPMTVVRETGVEDVFLAGWRGHGDLATGLNAADVVVLPSVHEQFGQVLVEGMACGLPCIAVDAHGPGTIVENGRTGWLVPPDDEDALAAALVEAVTGDAKRAELAEAAYATARVKYSWPSLAERIAATYAAAAEGTTARDPD